LPTKFGLTPLDVHTPREEALHSITVEVAAAGDSIGVKGVKGADSEVEVVKDGVHNITHSKNPKPKFSQSHP